MPPDVALATSLPLPFSLKQDTYHLVDHRSITRMSQKFANPEDMLKEARAEEQHLRTLSKKSQAALPRDRLHYLHDLFGAAFLFARRQKSGAPLPIGDDLKPPRVTENAPFAASLRTVADLISAKQPA